MASLSQFSVDVQRVDEGVWYEVPGADGLRLLIRSTRSKAYKAEQAKQMRELRSVANRNPNLGIEMAQKIANACIAKASLLGWENLLDETGQPLPYTPETCKRVMTERKYEPFQDLVRECVGEIDNQMMEAVEEVSGN